MKVKCINNDGYQYTLTIGKEYEVIDVQKGIFETPYVLFVNDVGVNGAAHNYRFEPRLTPEEYHAIKTPVEVKHE